VGCTGAVRLHTAFRATIAAAVSAVSMSSSNAAGRLPVDDRQFAKLGFNEHKQLDCSSSIRAADWLLLSSSWSVIQRVVNRLRPCCGISEEHQRGPHSAHFLPAIEVTNRILQYALKQHGQLCQRFVTILFGEFSIASCTISSATCSSRTAKSPCL